MVPYITQPLSAFFLRESSISHALSYEELYPCQATCFLVVILTPPPIQVNINLSCFFIVNMWVKRLTVSGTGGASRIDGLGILPVCVPDFGENFLDGCDFFAGGGLD